MPLISDISELQQIHPKERFIELNAAKTNSHEFSLFVYLCVFCGNIVDSARTRVTGVVNLASKGCDGDVQLRQWLMMVVACHGQIIDDHRCHTSKQMVVRPHLLNPSDVEFFKDRQ